jgi:hypothetical protein
MPPFKTVVLTALPPLRSKRTSPLKTVVLVTECPDVIEVVVMGLPLKGKADENQSVVSRFRARSTSR